MLTGGLVIGGTVRWLADLFPDGRLVEIPDSYTLVPEDQPVALAAAIDPFIRGTT